MANQTIPEMWRILQSVGWLWPESSSRCGDAEAPLLLARLWSRHLASRFGYLDAFVALLVLTVVFLAWKYLFTPIEWNRRLEDIGFRHVEEEEEALQASSWWWGGGGRARASLERVRMCRRLRLLGPLPPAFPNGWFALVESHELRPGQVKQVSALGENFAVFREEEAAGGRAHVLNAYCPHLGANMAAGGSVRGDCLECPFHGWRFRGADGKCTSVPYSGKVPDFARVKRWPTCEVNRMVFVWYHAEGDPPSWTPAPVPGVDSGEWRCKGRSRFYVNCHIQEIPENGADVAHLNAVHAPLLTSGGDLRNSGGSRLANHVWVASWSACQEDEALKHTATMNLRHELRFLNKFLIMGNDVKAHQIGPGYVVLDIQTFLGTVTILQTVTPIEPMVQKVVHRIYGSKYIIQPFANFVFLGETIMFERDVMVWNHKVYMDKPTLVSEDRTINRYRRWYSQFYSQNSPCINRKDKSLEW